MNQMQATYIAKQLEKFLATTPANIGVGGIITELQKTQADPLDVITAAWSTVRKIRAGKYRVFSMIHAELAEMLVSEIVWGPVSAPAPVAEFKPVSSSWSHQPVNPRLEAECATHPGGLASNCAGCRADALAGAPAYYQDLDQKEAA